MLLLTKPSCDLSACWIGRIDRAVNLTALVVGGFADFYWTSVDSRAEFNRDASVDAKNCEHFGGLVWCHR